MWMAAPLCLLWTLLKERNRASFEDEAPSTHRMKFTFMCALWSWEKLYSVDNTGSLVDFSAWLGYR